MITRLTHLTSNMAPDGCSPIGQRPEAPRNQCPCWIPRHLRSCLYTRLLFPTSGSPRRDSLDFPSLQSFFLWGACVLQIALENPPHASSASLQGHSAAITSVSVHSRASTVHTVIYLVTKCDSLSRCEICKNFTNHKPFLHLQGALAGILSSLSRRARLDVREQLLSTSCGWSVSWIHFPVTERKLASLESGIVNRGVL